MKKSSIKGVVLIVIYKFVDDFQNATLNYGKYERMFFYNEKVEVDFYIPEEKLAIQVSYSITQSHDTFTREVEALKKLPKVLSCERRLILTYAEEDKITDDFGVIEIIPVWKWLLKMK